MKFTVETAPAAKAFALLASVAEKPRRFATMPILATVRIVATVGEGLELTATDLDSVLSLRIAADVEESGSLCVAPRAVADALKKAGKGALALFRLKTSENWKGEADSVRLEMSTGRARMGFSTLSADDFPNPLHGEREPQSEGSLLLYDSAVRVVNKLGKYAGAPTGAVRMGGQDRSPWLCMTFEGATFAAMIDESGVPRAVKASPFNLDAGLSVDVDGERQAVTTRASGEIGLSAAQVAEMCGPVDPTTFVTIPDVVFHRGRVVAIDGIATDGSGRRFSAQRTEGKGKSVKAYCLSNAEFEAAWIDAPIEAPEQVSAPIAKPKTEDLPVMETVAIEAPAIILATTIVEPKVIAPAPIVASEPLEARLARIEAALGLAAPEPVGKRSPAHAAAIRRAWAMRCERRRLVQAVADFSHMERANHAGMVRERERAEKAEASAAFHSEQANSFMMEADRYREHANREYQRAEAASLGQGERAELVAEIDRLRAVVSEAGDFADRANRDYGAKRRLLATALRLRKERLQLRAERDGLAHNIGSLNQRILADARTIEALRAVPGAAKIEQPRHFIMASR